VSVNVGRNTEQPTTRRTVTKGHRIMDFATQAKELYRRLLTLPGCTWGADGVTLPPTAPAELQHQVSQWRQWLLACRRLHVLLHKPALLDGEANEAELLARRLNQPIRRYRLQLNAPEAGWRDMTTQ
jgi:hypothetical protein